MVEFFPENRNKLSAIVWNNKLGYSVVSIYIVDIQLGYIFSYNCFITWNRYYLFR
jgi:hypothetical protein